MDTMFRIKKGRESYRSKQTDIVSGTLDSIHQNIVSNIRQQASNFDQLKQKQEELEQQIFELEDSNELDDILKCSKLKQELKEMKDKLDEQDPLQNY